MNCPRLDIRLRLSASGSPKHRRATKPQLGRASFIALHMLTRRVSPSIFRFELYCENYRKLELTVVRTTGTGGFGAATTNASPFGQNRPAFGAPATTTSGSLFGSTTATAGSTGGFGGFGSTNNNTSGGGLFGAQKPAFGGGGGLFGNSTTPNTGFSLNNNQQTSAFPISSALGGNNAECQGTGNTPFTAFTEKEATGGVTNHFQSISFMQPYKNFSFEVGFPSLSIHLSRTLTILRNFD